MKALPIFGTIRCSMLFVCLLFLLACAVPTQSRAQNNLPVVTTGGASVSGFMGAELGGTATYYGPGPVNLYTWFQWGSTTAYGNVSSQVVNPLYGSMSYTIPTYMLQPNTVYHYRAAASNPYGTAYGNDATFTSPGPPAITNQPQSLAIGIGSTATFTVGAWASDSVLFYQWEKNGTNIPSATTSSFTIANAQSSDAGTYSVYVASDWGGEYPVYSSPASLKVGWAPTPVLQTSTSNGMFIFSWPVYVSGYKLVTSTDLSSTNWTSAGGTVVTNGNTVTVALPTSGTQRFFRLRYP